MFLNLHSFEIKGLTSYEPFKDIGQLIRGNIQNCPDAGTETKHNFRFCSVINYLLQFNKEGMIPLVTPLPALHQLYGFIDLWQSLGVSDELIHFDLLLQVSSDHLRHAVFTFKP